MIAGYKKIIFWRESNEIINGRNGHRLQKDNVKYSKEDKAAADSVIVRQVAQLHAVHNDKFGYVQGEKFDTWYEAYCSIITNLLDDYSKVGKTSKKGQKILEYAKNISAL